MTSTASNNAPRIWALVILIVCSGGTASMQQTLKVDAGNAAAAIHKQIAVGGFRKLTLGMTPCAASWTPPYYDERHVNGPWIGRFAVTAPAAGTWFIVVKSLDQDRPDWRQQITNVVPPITQATTHVFPKGNVAITLETTAREPGPCPNVRLAEELQRVVPARQRGQVGTKDDRWAEDGPELAGFQDGVRVRSWAQAVVRLEVVSPTGLIVPCTGYFITANILMTAAHCVSTDAGAATAVVHLGPRAVTGSDIRLVMSQYLQDRLDFSLLWINGAQPGATLRLAESQAKPLAVWQAAEATKRVSIFECGVHSIGADALSHSCDTVGGSSGSPVQELVSGDVVGLHITGCTASNATSGCRNGATRIGVIRARIVELSNELKAEDPAAAAQLAGAKLLPP